MKKKGSLLSNLNTLSVLSWQNSNECVMRCKVVFRLMEQVDLLDVCLVEGVLNSIGTFLNLQPDIGNWACTSLWFTQVGHTSWIFLYPEGDFSVEVL